MREIYVKLQQIKGHYVPQNYIENAKLTMTNEEPNQFDWINLEVTYVTLSLRSYAV